MKSELKCLLFGSILSHAFVFLLTISSLFLRYFLFTNSTFETTLSYHSELKEIFVDKKCSNDYENDKLKWKDCSPIKCGRGISDMIVSDTEADLLLKLAQHGFSYGGSDGGASILDLHSGALSKGAIFVDVFRLLKKKSELLSPEIIRLYKSVKHRIKEKIIKAFQLGTHELYLTKPTFFSQMTPKPAKTMHDEYWHRHVDRDTYGSFHYTSLLYLSTFSLNFTGGRFIFIDHNVTRHIVEPKLGRVIYFTSGSENEHFVEKVNSGVRFALTVAFTCDSKLAINDPEIT